MAVPFIVAQEEVLAMGAAEIRPIFLGLGHRSDRRMLVTDVRDPHGFQDVQDLALGIDYRHGNVAARLRTLSRSLLLPLEP